MSVIKNFKGSQGKKAIYKGTAIKLTTDFTAETLQARTQLNDIFKPLKDTSCQLTVLYLAKLSFRLKEK